jgi:TonB family protein
MKAFSPPRYLKKRDGVGFVVRLLSTLVIMLSALTAGAKLTAAQTKQTTPEERRARVAVLDFGETETGRRAALKLASALERDARLSIMDRDESRMAARGAGYAGSLNMTLSEARDLGAAIGSEFYITGDAQTLRRSPSSAPVYYEAYASVFIVSARTGRLINWERPSFEAPTPEAALSLLVAQLGKPEITFRYAVAIRRAQEDEQMMRERMVATASRAPLIEEAPENEPDVGAQNLRLPEPYRRLRPAYPETAARAEVEATVDVLVDIDAKGEVSQVEVARWAGFGLDASTVETVRSMHFRPAMRDGVAIPMRVLMRYNFRIPPKEKQ